MQFGNHTHLYILSGVAILLLLVGILNFINIYMVFMMKRSKEYGVKKVFGLQRLPLFLQIWLENQLLAVVALLTAWLLVEASQVPVSQLMGERIGYSAFDWQISLGFLVLLPLVTSVYPYIKYNYLSPIASIRSMHRTANPSLSAWHSCFCNTSSPYCCLSCRSILANS